MSDDGSQGITLIAFVGSVFSPYYAWARRRGAADPLNHCAFNVALYGRRAGRWAMTERGAGQVRREPASLSIGNSDMRWTGDALEMRVDERCAPVPRALKGRIRLLPTSMFDRSFALDGAGRHLWTPLAPCARIEVAFSEPAVKWTGMGYFDSNCGEGPLEDDFSDWTWSRASARDETTILYDVNGRDVAPRSLALRFAAGNRLEEIEAPPLVRLPSTAWRISRTTRADAGCTVGVTKTLEDAPFYSRSVLQTCIHGVNAPAIHESLDLNRFRRPLVQCMLPFRMPRIAF